jgi:hypothetical protein
MGVARRSLNQLELATEPSASRHCDTELRSESSRHDRHPISSYRMDTRDDVMKLRKKIAAAERAP